MNLNAKEIMTQPVISVDQDTSVGDLVDILNGRRISGVPVVDSKNQLVGVISITDLLAINLGDDEIGDADFHTSPSMDGLTELNKLLEPNEDIKGHPVGEFMSRQVITADASCSVARIANTLVTNRIHRIIIVKDKQPIGIVSVGDILRALSSFSE